MNLRNAILAVAGTMYAVFLASVALSAEPQPGQSPPKEITDLLDQGNITEAKRKLRDFRRAHPDDPWALIELARIEDDRNLAKALLKEAERFADPDRAFEASYLRSEMLFTEGNRSEAESILTRILAGRPDAPMAFNALYRLGMLRMLRGDTDNALIQFRKVREGAPDPFMKTLARAGILECHVARRDWNRVLVAAREVLEGSDDAGALTPRVLETLAIAWRELGNDANAEKFSRRILADFPGSSQAFALRTGGDLTPGAPSPQTGRSGYVFGAVGADPQKSADSGVASAGGASAEANEVPRSDTLLGGKVEYTVQAGAYELRENALKLHNRLRAAGYPVRIEMITVGDKKRYLVRIGTYPERGEADRLTDRMLRETGVRGNVVILR